MNTAGSSIDKKTILITAVFYIGLLLAELGSKVLAVLEQFSGANVNSSLSIRLGAALRFLAPDVVLYILSLFLVYILFAVLNAHYTILAIRWVRQRRPQTVGNARAVVGLVVNGAFFVAVYGLNAALYPASDLALIHGLAKAFGNTVILRISLMALFAVYLFGFFALNFRYARKGVRAACVLIWAGLLIAPLDPVFLIRKALPHADGTKNVGPNVIVIGIDSLNPKHTGYSGYPLPITPHLDSFLRENIVFENCYTPLARTFPAWYSILTGQYPKTNGVRLNLMKRRHIRSAQQCLGHILKRVGYSTTHLTDEVRFSNITSQEGFGTLRHPLMGIKDFVFGSFHDFSLTNLFFNNPLGFQIFPFLDANRAVAHLYDGRFFINDLLSQLDRLRGSARFFLAAHLCTAHWPYIHASPRRFQDRPGADPRMALYDSAVSKVDDQLGRILSALKARGLYENSIIIVLSDHGESAEGHGADVRDTEQNRTLLAWKPVGPPVHRDVGVLTRTIDIAPTILDLLGYDPRRFPYDGRSLRAWIEGVDPVEVAAPESVIMETEFSLDTPGGVGLAIQSMIDQGVRFYEFDQHGLITVRDDFFDVLIRRRNRAILTAEWKLVHEVIVRGGIESTRASLFDVRNDPECRTDVSAEHPETFERLMKCLRDFYGLELNPRK
jgi:arylsulfatase A-like enzyme